MNMKPTSSWSLCSLGDVKRSNDTTKKKNYQGQIVTVRNSNSLLKIESVPHPVRKSSCQSRRNAGTLTKQRPHLPSTSLHLFFLALILFSFHQNLLEGVVPATLRAFATWFATAQCEQYRPKICGPALADLLRWSRNYDIARVRSTYEI